MSDLIYSKEDVEALCAIAIAAATDGLVAKISRYEARLELIKYTDADGKVHQMTEHEKVSLPDGIECRDETISLLDEKCDRLTRELAAKDAEIAGLRAACEAYEEVSALLLKTWSDTQIDCLGSDAIEHAIITTLKNLGMAEVYAKNRQQ